MIPLQSRPCATFPRRSVPNSRKTGLALKRKTLRINELLNIKFEVSELRFQHFVIAQPVTLQRPCVHLWKGRRKTWRKAVLRVFQGKSGEIPYFCTNMRCSAPVRSCTVDCTTAGRGKSHAGNAGTRRKRNGMPRKTAAAV